ncbi:hypothetical protein [Nocardia sp. NBC_01327]|uniref:hypothetical protein n=1 Tax=Nocardia sp. NBC_01327 TaxID=2903593 RepID=UPI002E160030|nr:hypothetical protein OG326_34925 [Nocardia sp. NBC_01327]
MSEHDKIDQLAAGPDGRLLLAMTEERSYSDGDPTLLNEDFRLKINSYVYGVQSGYVQDLARRAGIADFAGVDIVLFSDSEPTPFVHEVLDAISREFAGQGIRAWWESTAADELGPEVIERALVDEAVRLCGPRWEFALLWVRLIGEEGHAGVKVIRSRKKQITENLEPSEAMLAMLADYKRACYDERTGTWLSGQISIAGPDNYRAQFSKTTDLPWVKIPPVTESLKAELAAFPRATEEIPQWIRECISL